MSQKQLSNVLIKILGLSVCVHSLVPMVTSLVTLVQSVDSGHHAPLGVLIYPLSLAAAITIGALLIFKSRALTRFFFDGEEEEK